MGKQTALTNFFSRKRERVAESWEANGGLAGDAHSTTKLAKAGDGDSDDKKVDPTVVAFFNANGLGVRLKIDHQRELLEKFVLEHRPDVFCISEVRIASARVGDEPDPSRIGNEQDRQIVRRWLTSPALVDYHCFWSLASTRYSGTCMLINRKRIREPRILRNLADNEEEGDSKQPNEGRIIIAKFEGFNLLHTYSPNNGWDEQHFSRRRGWDARIKSYAEDCRKKGRALIWIGDLNVAPADEDLSHPEWFRSQKSSSVPLPPNPDDRGQPGCTNNERRRLVQILDAGDMVDGYRWLNPAPDSDTSVDPSEPIFTWRGTPGKLRNEIGKYYAKGMRIDHALLSRSLLPKLKSVRILGKGADRQGFMGSDHSPVLLELRAS